MTAAVPMLVEAVQLLAHSTEDLLECGPAVVHLVERLAAVTSATISVPSADVTGSPPPSSRSADGRIPSSDALHLGETLRDLADEKLNSYPYHAVPACWRRLYTDASLYGAIARLASPTGCQDEEVELLEAAIGRLDLAIVISGTPGPMRHELALSLIDLAQQRLAEKTPPSFLPQDTEPRPAKRPRTRTPSEPDSNTAIAPDRAPYIHLPLFELSDLPAFLDPKHNDAHRSPFIVREGASSFPAFSSSSSSPATRRWSDLDYLRKVAGRGRIVPVEVGGDYTQAGWGQRMMEFGAFLDSLREVDRAAQDQASGVVGQDEEEHAAPPPLYYLAQHSLFRQFPALLSDLLIPDLVYSPPTHHFTSTSTIDSSISNPPLALPTGSTEPVAPQGEPYISPTTEDGYILNAWLGPRGTKSAAHTDPWWNCYVQMAGSKWVWVAPPECGEHMAAFGRSGEGPADAEEPTDSTLPDAVAAVAPTIPPLPSSAHSASSPSQPTADTTDKPRSETPSLEGEGHASEYMTNTSSFDVTTLDPTVALTALPRAYRAYVVPRARQAVLQEGDVLVMPPGWWHAMVGLETSFSVSMWF